MSRHPDLRRAAAAALTLAVLSAIGACRPATEAPPADRAEATPQRGGVAVLGSISDVDSWNEYVSRQSFANYLLRRMYLRLAHAGGAAAGDATGYEPSLAESWDISPDGLSITFRLRDAAWSDGRPVGADDVRFTWQAQTSTGVAWANSRLKSRISDVEVLDPRTVVFHFVRSYPDQFADAVDGGILPRHVFERVPFEEWGNHDWSTARVGSGPFLLAQHRPGQDIVMTRNPRYYRTDGPMLDRVVVRIAPDVVNLMTRLRSGEIDFVMNVPPRDAERLASGSRSAVGIVPFKLPRYEYLGWNCDRPPFDDPLMRRAITLAIDREALVESLVFGYGIVGSRPVPSSWWGAAERIEPWPYDPDEARRLLAERGYATVDADGTRRGDGPTLKIDLITNAGNKLRENTLVKIHSQLATVGVEVDLRTMEQRALIQKVQGGDFDGYLGGWNFEGNIPLDALFGSAALPPNGFNVVRYRSDAVDARLKRLDLASDREQMLPLLEEIQLRIHEDQPYTFLYERDGIAAYGSRLRGVRIDVPSDPLASLERFWVESAG